ncbi:NAD(P)-dependent oxidoreductase (plasmid) [Azospirillum brasilense]|uniref:NAD(P)-dependent oxidoreductase n=1 Tax=Azospirillum brasilense TaxID=192 RepID=A0A4D8QU23_AZOBR|nr:MULTISPECIES: NAD(P)-dependent oxidoreductase [Azospirillum]MDW7554484.1 NAD(P)-dependent oxidoreductase [Azospirillum brasilense]MDW7556357.1 NAD(P)-dependent oxidoreductase [Azospirillum brasilense]MDW7593997.1 NAD(P)-dependent oxidoreductase [Azospirillum brasilense]MDW7632099.1 NAD(P)-dependent oxidoreductase [Azospirillum brasilense]MDX5950033.1 NAD(P)-dependent oxidoreductase [Azospirillum brasilense]
MTVLITGATGLVGERLVPRLAEDGFACRVLLRAGKPCPRGATAVTGDILDPPTLSNAVRGVSAIVHLAAVFRTQDTHLIWKCNLDGTRNLIAAAKANAPDARFIMASTSNVYNTNNPHPGREDDPVEPKHAYPASKVAAEKELRESGLNWSIVRFPFVYGDGDGHLESLPNHVANWHPAQRMSTIHHRDIATAMTLALDGVFDRRIVNVADDAPLSIFELAGLLDTRVEASSEPLSNPWHLQVDGSLARTLGFRPTVRTVYQARQEGLM